MTGTNAPCINMRQLGLRRSAGTDRRLDATHGMTSSLLAECEACGGELEFDTDRIGRSIERCVSCGHTPPSVSRTSPAVGPDGDDDYGIRGGGPVPRRRESRKPLLDVSDPAVVTLRAARSLRDAGPMNPALAEAKREFDALEAAAREARKGGRPKGPDLKFGRGRLPLMRRLQFNDDAPGRPERLRHHPPDSPRPAAAAPSLPSPPRAEPTMKKTFEKTCQRSGAPFIASGPAAKYCGECDKCVAAAGEATPPRAQKAPQTSSKKPKTETKRARVETGFGRQVAAVKRKGEYGETIAKMLAEADVLEARRARLLEAVEHLEALGQSA